MRNALERLASISLILVAAAATALGGPAKVDKPKNIMLVGWDGAQREHVMQCLERGELPVLKQLSREGRLVNIDMRGKSDTKAGWSQILTGYDPEVTGVYSNAKFQPVPRGLSVFERLKEHFGRDNFVTVAVIGKKQHCGEITPPSKTEITGEAVAALPAAQGPKKTAKTAGAGQPGRKKAAKDTLDTVPGQGRKDVGARIVEENGKKYRIFPGSPYYHMKDGCDQWVFALAQDERVGSKAIEFLDQYKDKPFFFFVHFAEVDHSGHRHGENSKEYNDALMSNDTWTGRIVEKLKALGLYEQTLIYITADHGFDEDKTSHRDAPYVFLGTNDPRVCRDGDRADITPTILDRFGLDLAAFRPAFAGHSLLRPLDR